MPGQSTILKFFKGNQIPSYGFPLIILRLEKQLQTGFRIGMYFCLSANCNGQYKVKRKALIFKHIPHKDEFIIDRLKEMAINEIQNGCSSDVIANADFSLVQVEKDEFYYHIIVNDIKAQLYKVIELKSAGNSTLEPPALVPELADFDENTRLWSVIESPHIFGRERD